MYAAVAVAEGVVHKLMNANRSVFLHLQNNTNVPLCSPTWYGKMGRIHDNMPYCIQPKSSGAFIFHKTYWGFNGAEGVLVYQIGQKPNTNLCIFYSNPYFGSNKFSLKFSKPTEANYMLCKSMLETSWQSRFQVKWHNTEEEGVKPEYRDNTFAARGYCSQCDPAYLFVMLFQK